MKDYDFLLLKELLLLKMELQILLFYPRTPLPSYAPIDPLFLETLPAKNDPTKAQEAESCKEYTTRLMIIVISSVVKLAIHCPELYDHSSICLQKIWQHSDYFDPIVIQYAKDYLSLLQFPAALGNIFFPSKASLACSLLPDTNYNYSALTSFPSQNMHIFEN